MSLIDLRRYVLSCGLLLLPVLLWNLVFVEALPPALSMAEFWRDIPPGLGYVENAARTVVSALPFFMPLECTSPVQRRGLRLYASGVALYFAAWVPLMVAPSSPWAIHPIGFFAPAYTPLVWLVGLAMVGQRLYWGRWYRWWMFLIASLVFLAAHLKHTALVYGRSH